MFLASIIAAGFTVPGGHRDAVTYVRYLGIPFEVAIMTLIVIGARRTQRRLAAAGIELDVPERLRAVLGGSGMRSRIAEIVATEAAVFFYAFASWRRKPFIPGPTRGFSYHKRNALAALLYTLTFASLVETIAMDFVLRALAPRFALLVLGLSVFVDRARLTGGESDGNLPSGYTDIWLPPRVSPSSTDSPPSPNQRAGGFCCSSIGTS